MSNVDEQPKIDPTIPKSTAKAAKASKPAKEAKPAKEVVAKVAKVIQNGIPRPTVGTTSGMVWQIAENISESLNAPAPRKDVIAVTTEKGINEATAATQYGRWRKFHGLTKEIILKEVGEAAPVAEEAVAAE